MAHESTGDGDITASISELHNLLLATSSTQGFLQELAGLASRTVASGLSCAITLQPPGSGPLTIASSDTRAVKVDEVQYELDQGPCLRAARTGERSHIRDTTGPEHWGGFSPRAAANGIRSCLSMPLTAEGTLGAMNLYAPVPDAFAEPEIRRAELLAASASTALTLAARQASATALTTQMREALASRTVIDQALGVIMAQSRCTSSQAFEVLRGASQNRNITLRHPPGPGVPRARAEPPQPSPFGQ